MLRFVRSQCVRPVYAPLAGRLLPVRAQFTRFYSTHQESNSLAATSPAKDADVKYTVNHEYIALPRGSKTAIVGITRYAADALGDTTFVEVNDVPFQVDAGDAIGSVESVKSASDVYAPVSGKVVERNEELIANTPLLNSDPMGAAWLAKVEVDNVADLEKLLTLEQYIDVLADSH